MRWLLLTACLLLTATVTAQNTPLAPGYGALEFTPPAPENYRLPPLGEAADGQVVLASGKTARLHELFQDRIVLLSFIYTTCNDVNGCPLATYVLQRTQRRILEDPELAGQLRLISLSFDPAHDTPEVLKRYASALARDTHDWIFATTTSAKALAPILQAYDQTVIQERDASGQTLSFSHNLRVVLIDREKRIRNIYSVDFLHPAVIVNDIKNLLLAKQTRNQPVRPLDVAHRYDPHQGPGDGKQGYESADYVTHSAHLPNRVGKPAKLIDFIENPPLGLPPVPEPAHNPATPEKVALGRRLFFDRRLSLNDTISCAMCHIPEQGFTHNELATAVGFEGRTVRRNAPTLYNVAYLQRLFHDGREISLETQVWQPLVAANEMANPSLGAVIEKIRHIPDYRGLFEAAFDGRGPGVETIGMALASYQRTLNAANSPFDRWYYGKQKNALSESVRRGFALFTGKAGCANCHTIGEHHALFTDNTLHSTGIGWYFSMKKEPPTRKVQLAPGVFVEVDSQVIASASEKPPNDLGLYEVSQNPADRWRYKTPTLRNIALTAPYMHNGAFSTLEEVVEFYDQGGYQHELLDPLIQPLGLAPQGKADLVAFLRSLTGSNVEALVLDAFAAPVGDPGKQDPHWSHTNHIEY